MRQREEEEQPVMRKVSFQPVSGMIGNPGMSVVVDKVWAKWKGEEVTEVMEGEKFDIIVEYTASWPEGDVSIINPWTTVFTAVEKTHPTLRAYGKTRHNTSPHWDRMTVDDPASMVMPSYAPTFRIRPWGHPDWELISIPPEEDW